MTEAEAQIIYALIKIGAVVSIGLSVMIFVVANPLYWIPIIIICFVVVAALWPDRSHDGKPHP